MQGSNMPAYMFNGFLKYIEFSGLQASKITQRSPKPNYTRILDYDPVQMGDYLDILEHQPSIQLEPQQSLPVSLALTFEILYETIEGGEILFNFLPMPISRRMRMQVICSNGTRYINDYHCFFLQILDLVECSLVYKTWSMDDSFILNLT
jgi:hypothetical protein